MHAPIKPMSNCTMEPDAMRKNGYFYHGFGVNLWWWELPVKQPTMCGQRRLHMTI